MRYDSAQVWMLVATFAAPVLVGASCGQFMKAVAVTASAVFLGNLLYRVLFVGWNGLGNLENQLIASAAAVPLSVLLGAAGFAVRRFWAYLASRQRMA